MPLMMFENSSIANDNGEYVRLDDVTLAREIFHRFNGYLQISARLKEICKNV